MYFHENLNHLVENVSCILRIKGLQHFPGWSLEWVPQKLGWALVWILNKGIYLKKAEYLCWRTGFPNDWNELDMNDDQSIYIKLALYLAEILLKLEIQY